MAKTIAWILVSLFAAFAATYANRMATDPLFQPSAATWLVFGVSTLMAASSYKKAGKGDSTTGALILSDAVITWIIFSFILIRSGFVLRFERFEGWYLLGALVIGMFWVCSRNHRMANLLVNALITAGWLPTFHKIIVYRLSEPLLPWCINLVAGACGIILATMPNPKADATDRLLSKVYAWRSFLSIALNIVLLSIY